jgi:hypothetical protein
MRMISSWTHLFPQSRFDDLLRFVELNGAGSSKAIEEPQGQFEKSIFDFQNSFNVNFYASLAYQTVHFKLIWLPYLISIFVF